MKQINSILRTLCLAALLCMTSVNAFAYKVCDDPHTFNNLINLIGADKADKILVIDVDIETSDLLVPPKCAIIIKPGVKVTLTQHCDNENDSKIYVLGTLKLKDGMENNSNRGTIYIATGGTLISKGDINNMGGLGKIENFSLEFLTKAKLSGQAPTPTANGWKDYWAKGIESTAHDDFYPMYYYSDEACTEVISDLEAWKTNEGKIDKLGPFTIGSTTGDVDEGYCYHGDITFTDKDFYSSDYDFTVTGSITYSRMFKKTNWQNNWQPLYVPFAISYSDWEHDFEVAAINNFHEVTDDQGQTIKTELEIRMVKSGKLKPNHPYLIRAKDADEINPKTINISSKKMYKSEENSIVCSSVDRKYTFTGTYRDITGMRTKDYIFLSGGSLYRATDDNVKLSAQRWYLSIESLGSQVDEGYTSDVKAMEFDIKLLDDEATDIDEITVTRTPLKNSSEAIYNLNGMRVNDSYKGVVIKNGKKVLKK